MFNPNSAPSPKDAQDTAPAAAAQRDVVLRSGPNARFILIQQFGDVVAGPANAALQLEAEPIETEFDNSDAYPEELAA